MAVIGFVPHPQRPEAIECAESTAEWLRAEGHQARLLYAPAAQLDERGMAALDGLDLAVSLGGDGTMLRTVDLVVSRGIPVLGVNLGHLGYLTEVGPLDLCSALKRFLAGDFRLEHRMTLAVEIEAGGVRHQPVNALNDAVLQRLPSGHTVRLAVRLGGEPFLTYAADSIIVATPTGSTAYNLSARGPIASPRARVIIVTPVAPHMLFDRSLLLAPDEDVDFEVIEASQAELVVDGLSRATLSSGDVVRCRAGAHDARLVSFGGRDFHHILKQKFRLADR
ncbi:MAG: NAD(+)/NADH kinase [Actinomycetota bacterium]|nr:NAD(+)/NADH kinase [Actinomycetota bacterium]